MKNLIPLRAVITLALVILSSVKLHSSTYSGNGQEIQNNIFLLFKKGKPSRPIITSPEENSEVTSPLIIKGTAVAKNQVEIKVKVIYNGGNQEIKYFKLEVNSDHKWETRPVQLYLPGYIKDAEFVITAVQINGKEKRSRSREIRVKPKSDILRIYNKLLQCSSIELIPIEHKEEELMTKTTSDKSLNKEFLEPLHIVEPEIINPQNGCILSKEKAIQLIGKGLSGHDIEIKCEMKYRDNDHYFLKDFILTAIVSENGIWVTDVVRPYKPASAQEIEYTFSIVQISLENIKSFPYVVVVQQEN